MSARLPDEDVALLWRLAAEGHDGAFDALVRNFYGWVLTATASVCWDHQDAQDAAQECWVNVWKDITNRRDIEGPRGFLWACGVNAAKNLRARRRALKRGGCDPGLFTYDLLRELHGLHRWRHGNSQHDMEEREPSNIMAEWETVHRYAVELPPEHLAALDSFYFKNESLEALAKRTGVSFDHAKRILCHGIQILRALVEGATPAEWEAAAS